MGDDGYDRVVRNFHKPVHRPGDVIESWQGDGDPAELGRLSHDTAAALLHRVKGSTDPAIVDKVIAYADEHGIDDVAELWASADPDTLPGAMWRIHLLRHVVREDSERVGYFFRRGLELAGSDQAVAGANDAPSPADVVRVATTILRGAFTGDFAVALERAAAFCRIVATGADEVGGGRDARGHTANEYREVALELVTAAQLWRSGNLD